MSVKIRILDSNNNIEGYLELSDSKNEPFILNKKSSRIAEISTRGGTFSTTFSIPATKNNNKLFKSFYHSQTKTTKDFFVKKEAEILSFDNVFQKGVLRIKQVETFNGAKKYKAVFFGDNSVWISKLKNKYLSDIGFSSFINLGADSIPHTWTNTSAADEYVMSYINRGINRVYLGRGLDRLSPLPFQPTQTEIDRREALRDNHFAHVEDFNIDIFVKQILKKSFNSIGFNFNSIFFDGDGSALVHSEISENYHKTDNDNNTAIAKVLAITDNDFVIYQHDYTDVVADTGNQIGFFDLKTVTSDVGSNLSTVASQTVYTVPREGIYDISLDLNLQINQILDETFITNPKVILSLNDFEVQIGVYKNDIAGQYALDMIGFNPIPTHNLVTKEPASQMKLSKVIPVNTTDVTDVTATMNGMYFLPDDELRFCVVVEQKSGFLTDPSGNRIDSFKFTFRVKSGTLTIKETDKFVRNNTFNLSDVVDSSKHSILSLIKDYTKLFNLYWQTDSKTKTVTCEPRDTFYNSISNAKDWTDKINVSKYQLKKIVNDFNSNISFSYAKDSEDKIVEHINNNNPYNLGSYNHLLDSNLKSGTKNIQLEVYAASIDISEDTNVYDILKADAPTTAKLWGQNTVDRPEFQNKFAPRILNYRAVNSYSMVRESDTLGTDEPTQTTVVNNVPTCSFNLGKINLDFANKGLYDLFYSKTFRLIKEGFSLSIEGHLNTSDLLNVRNLDVVYFDKPFDLKGYWIIESISKIKPENKSTVKIDLLQFKNFEKLNENAQPPIKFIPIKPIHLTAIK